VPAESPVITLLTTEVSELHLPDTPSLQLSFMLPDRSSTNITFGPENSTSGTGKTSRRVTVSEPPLELPPLELELELPLVLPPPELLLPLLLEPLLLLPPLELLEPLLVVPPLELLLELLDLELEPELEEDRLLPEDDRDPLELLLGR
jgi:hypothetical protein